MDTKIHLGENVLNEATSVINTRTIELVKNCINFAFDYIESNGKDYGAAFLDAVRQLRNNHEVEQKIPALWSEHLFEKGLVPKGYCGLQDNYLIHNLHQDGYMAGFHAGYLFTMLAFTHNNVSVDAFLSIANYVLSNLGHNYEDYEEFVNQCEDEICKWINETKKSSSETK